MGKLTEKEVEQLTERLVNRIEEANSYTLETIGKVLKGLDNLTPSQAHKITQIMKFGGSYDKIAKKLAEVTGKNLKDIEKIFTEVAKKDLLFAEQFYKYRDVPFIPYSKNKDLQKLVNGYIRKAQKDYLNVADMSLTGLASKSIGFSVRDKNNKVIFKGLKNAYYDAIDDAVLNVSTGLMTAQEAKRKVINSLAGSGIKKMDFKNGRSIRMDSIVRMNIQSSLRDLHNQLQEQFGEEYGADGIEISVHGHPAEDHEMAQGRQFSKKEYDKLQREGKATTYDKKEINIHLKRKKTGKDSIDFRPISEYNCYHYVFAVILGVNKPDYTDEQLQKIIDDNNKEIEFEGKKYTTYEMTQLQRNIEREVRKEKDLQIMSKASGDKEGVIQHQKRIKELLVKYNEVSKKANLPTKKDRLTVSGYHYSPYKTPLDIPNLVATVQKKESNINVLETYNDCKNTLNNIGIKLDTKNVDIRILKPNTERLYKIVNRYDFIKKSLTERKTKLRLGEFYRNNNTYAHASRQGYIEYNTKYFKDYDFLVEKEKHNIDVGWHQLIDKDNAKDLTITHEFGHQVEYIIQDELKKKKMYSDYYKDDLDKVIMDKIYDKALSNLKKDGYKDYNRTLMKNKWLSKYGKSKRHYEAFAELFSGYILGDDNPLTEALGEYLDEFK